jgi:hypothetical protein
MGVISLFKRWIGLAEANATQAEATTRAEHAVKSISELEESQRGLEGVIRDTGFFLGDALMVERPKRNDRNRARRHDH